MREHGGPGDEAERERRRRERRRENRRDAAETACDTCELVDSVPGCGRGSSSRGDGDGCSCDGPCDLSLLRVSALLLVAAVVAPPRVADGLVRASLRGYQRCLSRFTPACPSTPSCSAYALIAVTRHGARRGLRLAAARVRNCGPAPEQPRVRRAGSPALPTRGG